MSVMNYQAPAVWFELEEKEPDGEWDVFCDYFKHEEASKTLDKMRKDWPASEWRLVRVTREVY